jgi:uncharacterized paraquat-inducible protein A
LLGFGPGHVHRDCGFSCRRGVNALEYALPTAGGRFIFCPDGRLPSEAHWCPGADGGEGITVFQRGTPQLTKRQLTNFPDCGNLQFIPALPACAARSIRCRHFLRRTRHDALIRPLACALAGLALYIAVIALQFSAIEVFGREHAATLVSFPEQLYITGFWELACLVLLFIIILPPIKLLLLALVLLGLRLSRPPYVLRLLFRIYSQIGSWAMIEVFLVGFFVAYTRLVNLATVGSAPQPGDWRTDAGNRRRRCHARPGSGVAGN